MYSQAHSCSEECFALTATKTKNDILLKLPESVPFIVRPQKKSIHIPIRSKYNRVTKRARYLHENPSCMLCNILHRYLQQADYSVIEEATMVSAPFSNLFLHCLKTCH